jgi:hypothetical protein
MEATPLIEGEAAVEVKVVRAVPAALVLVVPGSKVHLPGQLLITLQVQEEGAALAIRVRMVRVGQVLQIQEMVVSLSILAGLAL